MQRHSKMAGAGLVNRQKRHFAKVRTQLQNGATPHNGSFMPSYIQKEGISLGGQPTPFGEGSVRGVGHSKKARGRFGGNTITVPTTSRSYERQKRQALEADLDDLDAREFEGLCRATESPRAKPIASLQYTTQSKSHRCHSPVESRKSCSLLTI